MLQGNADACFDSIMHSYGTVIGEQPTHVVEIQSADGATRFDNA